MADGTVASRGTGANGLLTDGTLSGDNSSWQTIPSLSNIVDIAIAHPTALALQNNGRLWVWGANNRGLFGNGSLLSTSQSTPFALSW
jgi:alpha-tubulin suppressor-like RCC1 family protein